MDLSELGDPSAYDAICRAYAEDRVSPRIIGLEDVEMDFGMRPPIDYSKPGKPLLAEAGRSTSIVTVVRISWAVPQCFPMCYNGGMNQVLASQQDLQDLIIRLTTWAADRAEIDALYLFGSQVEGRIHAASDVDVAVLARQDIARERLWRLEDRWAVAWPEKLDLHVLNLAPIPAQFEIITHGRRLWQRSLERVAEYESWVRRRYWDMEPWLERDWQAFVRRLWEQRNDAERQEYQATLAQVRAVHRRVRETAGADARRVQE